MVDFLGPKFPADPWADPSSSSVPPVLGAVITTAEFREVLGAFPYAGFGADSAKAIFCGLCRDKPVATFDNFVSAFGREYGLDGQGRGKEEYWAMCLQATAPRNLTGNLDYLHRLLEEGDEVREEV
jgi:hypothetical protein